MHRSSILEQQPQTFQLAEQSCAKSRLHAAESSYERSQSVFGTGYPRLTLEKLRSHALVLISNGRSHSGPLAIRQYPPPGEGREEIPTEYRAHKEGGRLFRDAPRRAA
jgi:hypothetical protein